MAYDNTKVWIELGFGVGEQPWVKEAVETFGLTGNSGGYAGDELNRIRVEISKHFAGLNDYFSARLEEARRQVGVILQSNFGILLAEVDVSGAAPGTALLDRAAVVLAEASEPCMNMSEAVKVLIELNLEYQTQFHPQVRQLLDGLNVQRKNPLTGAPEQAIVVDLNEAGARKLFAYCGQQARHAAWETRKALLAEQVTPLLVIYAAVEQFEDTFIRSGDSAKEFARLAFSYRDELWPGAFEGLTEGHARYAKVTRSMKTITEKLA
jgi:hypothetical protein